MLCGIGAPGTPRFCALKERGWNLCCGTTHDSRTTKQPDVIRRKRIHFADSAQCNVLSCPDWPTINASGFHSHKN